MRGPVAKLFSRVLIERLGLRFPIEIAFGEDTICLLYTSYKYITIFVITKIVVSLCPHTKDM